MDVSAQKKWVVDHACDISLGLLVVILICLISAAGSQSGTSIAFGIIFTLAALGVHGLAKYEQRQKMQ